MKLIKSIVRPNKVDEVKDALSTLNVRPLDQVLNLAESIPYFRTL